MNVAKLTAITVITTLITLMHADLSSAAQSLAINLNDRDEVELTFIGESKYSENSTVKNETGILSALDEKKNKNIYAHTGFTTTGLTDIPSVVFGLGIDLAGSYIDASQDSYGAVALKVKLGYVLPFRILTTLLGSVSYAPKTLCLSNNIDKFSDTRFEIDFDIIDGGTVYFGYRDIKYGIPNAGLYTLNKSGYGGFKIHF